MTGRFHPLDLDLQQPAAVLVPHPRNVAFQNIVAVSPLYSRQATLQRGQKLVVQRGPHRRKVLVGAVASILSLATILAVLAVCRTIQRRVNSAAAVRRNLSGIEDDETRSDILEKCLDMEEERGLGPATSDHSEDANEAKARLVAMLHESAADFERMRALTSQGFQRAVQLPPRKIPRLNEPWTPMPQPQASVGALWPDRSRLGMGSAAEAFDADAWATTNAELDFVEGGQRRHITKLNEELELQENVSASRAHSSSSYVADADAKPPVTLPVWEVPSGEVALTPQVWLDNASASMKPPALERNKVDAVPQAPAMEATVAAFTSAGFVPPYSENARRVEHADADQGTADPSEQMKGVQQLEHPVKAFRVTFDALERPTYAEAVQATSSRGGEACEAGDTRLHPFVRLPAVNPEDVRRSFRVEFALSYRLGISSPMELYMKMRTLFAKASLAAEDVETLMTEAELLANYAAVKLARPYTSCTTSYLVRKLSSLFMAFDHLVCTIELLGAKMNTSIWWSEFVKKFHTDYRLPEKATKERTEVLNKLVNRLSSALAIYKSGKRPPLREIIQLKRSILSQTYKESQLSNPLWRLWLQDDKDFSCGGGGSGSHSDTRAHGQGEAKKP
ncbi:hypothetical protein, conserved [Eimeria praecox]|uniref:Transmembrane protein n=1 Tax=Eimeria praecox TaxID=51316 RepID=U6H674_9EIME|nr:hypothetical protein, conserved [Eimeria praecox]